MVMNTIENTEQRIAHLIRTVESDLNRRGVLMIDRAQSLLTSVKAARLNMALSEQTTPTDFFNAKWRQQATALQQCEARLQRIIRGVAIPTDDHEAT